MVASKKRVSLQAMDSKLDKILKKQTLMLKEEDEVLEEDKELEKEEELVEKQEKKIEQLEKKSIHEEGKMENELASLEHLEKEIEKEVEPHPLRKITYKDMIKGSIGAFFGVATHYSFLYGIEVANELDMVRATILYPLSFIIGGIFLYATGFRKIKDRRILAFLPVRLIVLYLVAIATSIAVLFLFYPNIMEESILMAYKQVAAVTVTAIVGACTADMIGRE